MKYLIIMPISCKLASTHRIAQRMRIKPTAAHPQPTPLTLEKQGVNFSGAAEIYIKKLSIDQNITNSAGGYQVIRQRNSQQLRAI